MQLNADWSTLEMMLCSGDCNGVSYVLLLLVTQVTMLPFTSTGQAVYPVHQLEPPFIGLCTKRSLIRMQNWSTGCWVYTEQVLFAYDSKGCDEWDHPTLSLP